MKKIGMFGVVFFGNISFCLAQQPASGKESSGTLFQALCTLAWPAVTLVIFALLYPQIRKILRSRSFLVKVGGMEINVQSATNQISDQLHELQNQVIDLSCRLDGRMPDDSADGKIRKWRVLWVTGRHESHALEIHYLEADGIEILKAHTTAEALGILYAQHELLDGVITGVSRPEHGVDNPSAGLELIKRMKAEGYSTPIFVMCSEKNVRAYKAALKAAGAVEATSNSLQLYGLLKHSGINCHMKPLDAAERRWGANGQEISRTGAFNSGS